MQQLLVDELTGDRVILAPARALRPDTFRVHAEPGARRRRRRCPFCRGQRARDAARGRTLRRPGGPTPPAGAAGRTEQVPDRRRRRPRRARGRDPLPRARRRPRRTGRTRRRTTCCVSAPGSRRASISPTAPVRAGLRQPRQGRGRVDRAPARATRRPRRRAPRGQARASIASAADAFAGDQAAPRRTRARPTSGARRPRRPRSAYASRSTDGGARFDRGHRRRNRTRSAPRCATRSPRSAPSLGDVAYNVMIETAPPEHDRAVPLVGRHRPRLDVGAGFELGTGLSVNIVAPADAAALLRDAESRARAEGRA